ncbi:TetR/AcrR family transcriptional regulator [Acinetobacter haemolyticus]|uniref:TetR/AcrR family transcriptional regulator n=1 Tax=Acinetobacter haemolyticus TaxID=29430 RepID=A0A4P7B6E2_ACIHA|nr:TetR/AcrR family transcriptional regulator [Acinetobacter haemolyticus]QBQ17125.1 TetR/AcrR family transcriptional regulator [Acinetobacter haemolyticus]
MSKKEDTIQTALDLFSRYSYGSVGINLIIEESGVAKSSFYKYFPSKEQLIVGCLIKSNGNIQSAIQTTLELFCPDDHLGKIKAIYDWYTNRLRSENFHGCLFQKATIEILKQYPSVIEPIREYRVWLHELLRDLIVKLQVTQAAILASIFMNVIDGMTIYTHTNQNDEQIAISWKYLKRLIINDSSLSELSKAS